AALGNNNPIFIVEGEKDVDALWERNIPATCNSGGAGKWRDDYSKYFEGATVNILPDNDPPGRDAASANGNSEPRINVSRPKRRLRRNEKRPLRPNRSATRPD